MSIKDHIAGVNEGDLVLAKVHAVYGYLVVSNNVDTAVKYDKSSGKTATFTCRGEIGLYDCKLNSENEQAKNSTAQTCTEKDELDCPKVDCKEDTQFCFPYNPIFG